MRKLTYALTLSAALIAASAAYAEDTVMVGGQSMYPQQGHHR